MSARGFAAPLALLLLLAITGLAHGVLVMARHEHAASRLAVRLLARELSVRGALLSAAHRGDTLPAQPLGGGTALPTPAVSGAPPVRLRVVRLAAELHLLVAEAVAADGAGAAGLVVWALDPLTRARTRSGEVGAGGPVSVAPGGRVVRAGPAVPDACAAVRPILRESLPSWAAAAVDPPGLGLLPGDSVLARAPVRIGAMVSPAPSADPWVCHTGVAGNWGAPTSPGHPCAEHRPFVASDGDLVVAGGEGQGVMVVRGDVALRGTRYDGLVLAGGRVRLDGGTEVRGRILAAGGVFVGPGARLLGDGCAVYRSLLAAPGLRAPLVLPEGAWIRPL